VPYNANGAGQAPSTAAAPTTATTGAAGAGMGSPSSMASPAGSAGGKVLGMAAEVPVGGGMVFTAAKVVVTQPTKGEFKAFSAICTHVGCLCNQVANGTINCPCHGATFKITDGSVVTGPAASPLAAASVTVADGKILMT
jgi:Rieske Fe-S protein